MALTLRTKTGLTNGFALWKRANGNLVTVHISQATYDAFVAGGGVDTDSLNKPALGNPTLEWAVGGCPAFDTIDGYLNARDCYVESNSFTGTILVIKTIRIDITHPRFLIRLGELNIAKRILSLLPGGNTVFDGSGLAAIEAMAELNGEL